MSANDANKATSAGAVSRGVDIRPEKMLDIEGGYAIKENVPRSLRRGIESGARWEAFPCNTTIYPEKAKNTRTAPFLGYNLV
jgi:hypothetical protein